MLKLADVVSVLDDLYDPRRAESWDAVGLVCGDPDASVAKILFAVDPVNAVVDEALQWGADLLITHHPLLLTAVHGVPASDPKGRLVHRLIMGGCALFVIHTNADRARPGVSDALANAIGLIGTSPLEPDPTEQWDKIVCFVPVEDADRVIDALAAAGAGTYGAYERCAWSTTGEGTFRPGLGSNPTIGRFGEVERVAESRVEMVVPRSRRSSAITALRSVHPYEEPAFDVIAVEGSVPAKRGIGRIGRLTEPIMLGRFVDQVAAALPATRAGLRATGDPSMIIERVAVCGGSGGSYAELAREAGADAYVTADLRHHPASEVAEGSAGGTARRPMALIDAAHWGTEWPWLESAAEQLRNTLQEKAGSVETRTSRVVTDPWTVHVPARR